MRARARAGAVLVAGTLAMLACIAALQQPAVGASSSIVVSMEVESATYLDASGCADDVAGITAFGVVQPGTIASTSGDCAITFGSSNDTASLLVSQQDERGQAMWRPTDGALATGFGGGSFGVVGTSAIGATSGTYTGAIAYQDGGRTLLLGRTGGDATVHAYRADGTLDPSFGSGGIATIPFGCSIQPSAMDVDPSGRIVVSGDDCGSVAWAARLTAAGQLDSTFGTAGTWVSGIPIDSRDMRVDSQGRAVIVGNEVWRLLEDGGFDTSFDDDGRAPLPPLSGPDARGVAIRPDDRIVITGSAGRAYVAEYSATDGSFTTWAGGDGYEQVPAAAPASEGRSIAITHDGGVAIAAYGWGMRFTSAGLIDTSFGTGGIVDIATLLGNGGVYHTIVAQPDGKLLFVGKRAAGAQMSVVRLHADGTLDTTFATGGEWTADPSAATDELNRSVWADDGDLVAMGAADGTLHAVRFDGSVVADYAVGATDWDQGANMFGACLRDVGATATADWSTSATCPTSDGAWWNAVPATPAAIAHTTVSGTVSATASLRFGVRTALAQQPGRYVAPVSFDVVAPAI